MGGKKNSRKRKRLPIDMRTVGRKKKKSRAKIDYLTNLPANILLRILSNVPMSSFLDLSQTHSQLRWFMHNCAATICNLAIIERFPVEAKFLEASEIGGWLTPGDGFINNIKPRKGTRWVVPGLQLRLCDPGPQFLYFLEKRVLRFSSPGIMKMGMRTLPNFMDSLNEESPVVFGGQDYPRWVWLREMVWYHGVPS